MATVTFTPPVAVAVGKIIPLAVGGDPSRPNLMVARFTNIPGTDTVRIDMTDGYKAARLIIDGAGHVGDGFLFYGRELAKALTDAAKGAGKHGTVSVLVSDGAFDGTVRGGGVSITVPTSAVDFPNVDSFMDAEHPTESGAMFDANRLGDMIKAAGVVAGKNGLVTMETVNPTKPARFTANGAGVSMVGVLMPCRK